MDYIEVALLIRLVERGGCKQSARASKIIDRFRLAGWIEPASRAQEWTVRPEASAGLQARLAALLPSWREDVAQLSQHGLDATDPRSYHALAALKTPHTGQGLVHRKVWNASTAADSKKSSLLPTSATLTDDWCLRGRVNCKTVLGTLHGGIDLEQMTSALSEFSIPERGWLSATGLRGELPDYVVTVENLGPLVDLPMPSRTMILFSQGAAGTAATQMLKALPNAVWLHFGDLDPAGIRIAMRLARTAHRPLQLYVPSFAREYMSRMLPARQKWPTLEIDAPFVQELAEAQTWIEQELFLFDPRLPADLNESLARARKCFV